MPFGIPEYFGLRGNSLSVTIGLIAGLDFLLFGYDQGVTGGLLEFDSFRKYMSKIDIYQFQCPQDVPNCEYVDVPFYTGIGNGMQQIPSPANYNKYSNYQGITVAAYNLGCFFGAVATIWIGNALGRKRTIFLGSSIMVIGALLQCTSYGVPQFIVGRIVTGLGNGLNTSTVPTWQSETSKSHRRGPLVMIEGSLIAAGIMTSYWIDFGCRFIQENEFAWRFPLAFQIFFALIILLTIWNLPESPRWLVLKGRDDEAMDILEKLNNVGRDDEYIQSEFEAVKDTVLEMSKGSFSDLFRMGDLRNVHRVVLAYVNQMFQQISGINLITYYAPNIYSSIGLSGYLPQLLAALNGTEYFLASIIPIFIVERVGRRPLMLFGAAGMSLTMVALTVSDYYNTKLGNKDGGIAAAVFLFVFNSFFAIGWLGMTWLYPAEIVPLRIRAPANALATSANWIFNFTVVMIGPPAFATIGYKTYIIFAVINAFIFPVVLFFMPETKNRSLEEMDTIFAKAGWFSVVKVAREEPHRFDKHGNLVISYKDTGEHERRQSVASASNSRNASRAASRSGSFSRPGAQRSFGSTRNLQAANDALNKHLDAEKGSGSS